MLKLKKFLANIPRQVFLYYNKHDLLNVVISCYEQVKEFARVMQEFINNVNSGVYNKPVTNIITKKGNNETKYIVHKQIPLKARKGSIYYFDGYPKIQCFTDYDKEQYPGVIHPKTIPLLYDGIHESSDPVAIKIINDFDFKKEDLYVSDIKDTQNQISIYDKIKSYIQITPYYWNAALTADTTSPYFKIENNKVICTRTITLPEKFHYNYVPGSKSHDILRAIIRTKFDDKHFAITNIGKHHRGLYISLKAKRAIRRKVYNKDEHNNYPTEGERHWYESYRNTINSLWCSSIAIFTYHKRGYNIYLISKDYYTRIKKLSYGSLSNHDYIHTKKV